jgi:hypothetical protein
MILFPVSEKKNRWLKEKMEALGIHEKDIEEKFIRSSGRGGQKVNKTSTCVYLKHIPTGVEIKCMRERNQSLNRFLARRELVMRIEKLSGQLTRSAAPSPAFEGGVKKRRSGSTLSLRPETSASSVEPLRPRGKPRPLGRGVDGLTPEEIIIERARRQKSKREKRARLKYRRD